MNYQAAVTEGKASDTVLIGLHVPTERFRVKPLLRCRSDTYAEMQLIPFADNQPSLSAIVGAIAPCHTFIIVSRLANLALQPFNLVLFLCDSQANIQWNPL